MNEQEHWKPVSLPQFSMIYDVSDWGHVRRHSNSMCLRASPTGQHHHYQLKLRMKDGTSKNCLVSHLVMGAFSEDPAGRPIGYRDKNPRNCRRENLYLLPDTAAHGGGHSKQGLARSIAEIATRIWAELLKETLPLLVAATK